MNHGYRKIRVQGAHPHKNKAGYVPEHRLVMEEVIGRYLSDEEEVHHINRDRGDNRRENLQLMTRTEHRRLHGKERSAYAALRRASKHPLKS